MSTRTLYFRIYMGSLKLAKGVPSLNLLQENIRDLVINTISEESTLRRRSHIAMQSISAQKQER